MLARTWRAAALERQGYDVVVVTDGASALRLLENKNSPRGSTWCSRTW